MVFEHNRAAAEKNLNYFIENKLSNYSKLRNFSADTLNRLTTSKLSPYITHGILNEAEVIKEILKKHSFSKSEKFINEILWRIYWKGYLELRPQIWDDFISDLKAIEIEYKNNRNYKLAIEGSTNIKCFNDWLKELKETNYLHNHVRMWFASIWIFTLNLPWQLGASLFIKYLYDGDISSNTLSWRWVAGIQTVGKNYLAKEWNITKFTNEKYKNIKVNENALPIIDMRQYQLKLNEFLNPKIKQNLKLLIFENNLSFEESDFSNKNFEKIFLVKNNNRKIELCKNVKELKNNFINDQANRLKYKSINYEVINIEDVIKINEDVFALYPNIGENFDFIKSYNSKNIKYLYRKIDLISWKYCNKGFFNFKNYIPKIIKELN